MIRLVTKIVHHRKERFDIFIGRPSKWSNPFREGFDGSRSQVIKKYEKWLLAQPELVEAARRELKDKVLGCWCKPKACHGDVLVRVVDTPE